MPEIANVNGKICPVHEAVIPAEDRGFLFGDGVYEVLRSYNGRLWAFDRHMKRLERSLREIQITGVDFEDLSQQIRKTFDKSQIQEATVYVQITRGAGPRSHAWVATNLTPTFFMTVRHFQPRGEGNERGIRAIWLRDQRWGRCDIKSVNLLPNVLAKQEARNMGAYEAIFVDSQDRVLEGTSSSVFSTKNKNLFIPPNSPSILPSITREFISEIANDLRIPLVEKYLSLSEFYQADEAFIAGTGDEIMGIIQLSGISIGGGKVGQTTKEIYRRYKDRISRGED
jgi:D-alanine transaminase